VSKPVFGQREQFIEAAKVAADAQKALAAIRQLGIGVVKRCDIKGCMAWPYEAPENSFPCDHLKLFDASLRSFGLPALNAAAKIWAAEKELDQ
jgi:hypothetical protein